MPPEGPDITVALPVYNGETTLGACLDALAAQTSDRFVVRIYDNASTDGTGEICAARAEADPRFIYHRNPTNIGPEQNYIDALMAAETPYFLWRADDDLCDAPFLERLHALLEANPTAALAAPRVEARRPEKSKSREFPFIGAWRAPRIVNILRQMFHSHPSWIYGLWRTEGLRHYYMTTWERYPEGWANDHLVLLGVILDERVVGDDSVRFIQQIGVRAGGAPAYKPDMAEKIATKTRMLPLYLGLCRRYVAERTWSGWERWVLDRFIGPYARKRVNTSKFQIFSLKVRKRLREMFAKRESGQD